jgi:predicted MPP superfamily phosphohydrolase
VQHFSVLSFSSIFFLVQVTIALAASSYLSKWVDLYRLRSVRVSYWLITLGAYILIFYRRVIISSDYGKLDELVMFFLNLAYVWSFGLLIVTAGFIVLTLFRLIVTLKKLFAAGKKQPLPTSANIKRRSFLKTAALAWPCLSLGLSAEGVINANNKIVLTKKELFLPGLAPALDGLKIAQISDTHIGAYFSMAKLKKVVAMLEAEKPDLLVITGDLIDERSLLAETFAILNPFAAKLPYGAYFCWGNHEYFRNNFTLIKKYFDQSPITVLRNENCLAAKASSPLYLVGVDYPRTRKESEKIPLRQKMLAQAMQGVPANATPILISHHSDFIDEAFAAGIPFSITGHTHGGQAALFGKSLLPVSYKYMLGIYQKEELFAYVNVGAGHWLPFRFNCPAEVAVFTLKSN